MISAGRPDRGFTLMETLLVMSISFIILGIGVPSYAQFIRDLRVSQATNELRQSLRVAQVEAVKRNSVVRLCPSNDGVACNAGDSWNQGWITYIKPDESFEDLTETQVLFYQNRLKNVRITKNGHATVKINPGYTIGSNQTFTVCPKQQQLSGTQVVLTQAGRIRTELNIGIC